MRMTEIVSTSSRQEAKRALLILLLSILSPNISLLTSVIECHTKQRQQELLTEKANHGATAEKQ